MTLLAEATRGSRTRPTRDTSSKSKQEKVDEQASAPAEPQDLNSVQRSASIAGVAPPDALSNAQKRANAAVLKSDDGAYTATHCAGGSGARG